MGLRKMKEDLGRQPSVRDVRYVEEAPSFRQEDTRPANHLYEVGHILELDEPVALEDGRYIPKNAYRKVKQQVLPIWKRLSQEDNVCIHVEDLQKIR